MTPSFSPFLAQLLMAGLARRALLRTDARSEPPSTEAAEGAQSPAQPSLRAVSVQ